ncbi:MAG: hypothetical protein H0V56_10455 [Chthoniobacterales bacterium]|jgi:hypothetical protein|nr:hypothetical protein [Chthoniobacterales bacterium]
MSTPDNTNGDPAEKQREQEPPVGDPEELHPHPEERVKEAAKESAEKGYPYETPRPTALD